MLFFLSALFYLLIKDKILWMCGGHDTPPEGEMSRKIVTTGKTFKFYF